MKALFISEGPNGCGLYRSEIPIRYLSQHGVEGKLSYIGCSNEELAWADVLIVQKQFDLAFLKRIESWQRKGKKVIYELDDDLFNIPTWNPAHPFYQRVRQNVLRYLKMADALIVSTDFLAKQMRKYIKPVFVCPNSLDFQELDKLGPAHQVISALDRNSKKVSTEDFYKRCEGKTVIGWLGSPTHKKDLEIVVPALKRVARQYKDQVMILMGGAAHRETVKATSYDQIMFLEMVPPRTYLRYLAALPIDIGLAPVADHLFNYSKSNLKAIEYMAVGYVPVVSNLITYNTTVQNGKNGFVCNGPAQWIQTLRKLINDPALCKTVQLQGDLFVRSRFDAAVVAGVWATAIRSV